MTEKALETWRSKRNGPAWLERSRVIRSDVNDLDPFLANGRQEPLKTAAQACGIERRQRRFHVTPTRRSCTIGHGSVDSRIGLNSST